MVGVPVVHTLAEAARVLEQFQSGHVDRPVAYTHEYIQRFMATLGNPQERLRVIHVAGTSGKSSTCHYIAAMLHASGKTVGHTTSPHLYAINERVQIGLQPLAEVEFCSSLSTFLGLVKKSGIPLTFFEVLTAFAYWLFAQHRLEYAVIEVGLGGLLDATNIVERQDKVAVITDIGLDHQSVLGATLQDITMHKAGIIQLRNTVFTYRKQDGVIYVIMQRAAQKQADLHVISEPVAMEVSAGLPHFQQRNFYLAHKVTQYLAERDGFTMHKSSYIQAAAAVIPGRLQPTAHKGRTIFFDIAHNAQKITALHKSLAAQYPEQLIAVLVAFKSQADQRRMASAAEALAAFAEHIIVTGSPSDRTVFEDPELVKAYCKAAGQWSVEIAPHPAAGLTLLAARPEPILVVTGSAQLLSAVRTDAT